MKFPKSRFSPDKRCFLVSKRDEYRESKVGVVVLYGEGRESIFSSKSFIVVRYATM